MDQLPLFKPDSDWVAPDLNSLPDWKGIKRIGIDTETNDPDLTTMGPGARRGNSHIAGISFAIEDGPSFYLPTGHKGGGNLPEENVMNYLRHQAKNYEGIICGANLQYDLDWLDAYSVRFTGISRFLDVMIADPLISELHKSYSLQAIAERWGFSGKEENLMKEACVSYGINLKTRSWKGKIWTLPAEYVGPYAEEDASLPLQILRKQEREIDKQELGQIYELESAVMPVLLKMRQRGVLIDQDRLAQISNMALETERAALHEIKRLSGVMVAEGDVYKAAKLVPVMKAINFSLGETPTGKPKIDKAILEGSDHPVCKQILVARQYNKLRTTFVQSIMDRMVDGRIHCLFNQLRKQKDDGSLGGAGFGRLSSEQPNLQQQPSRGAYAKQWRGIYRPDHGEWICNDYSQQEPRMTTHYAYLARCGGADKAVKAYVENPDLDNHQFMADLTGLKRTYAKDIFLGLCYGMGGAKLARNLGLPTAMRRQGSGKFEKVYEVAGPEAQNILDTFNHHAPYIKRLSKKCETQAKRVGFIRTILGRKCRFPQINGGGFDWTHKALNRLIQGSSADQTKQAMVEADKAGLEIQLQVHDEINMSGSPKDAKMLADIMVECVPLEVPSKVDVETGPSWGEIE